MAGHKKFDPPDLTPYKTDAELEAARARATERQRAEDAKALEAQALKDEVESKIKSKFLAVKGSMGKIAFLDTPAGVDYTAGGLLHVRWVKNNDKDVSRRRDEGYHFPEEISSRLKNVVRGSLVLMVCLAESKKTKDANLRARANQLRTSTASRVRGVPHLHDLEFQP